ncbi:MAG: GTP-binding protein [Candidatus Helarchaeota archaeon]
MSKADKLNTLLKNYLNQDSSIKAASIIDPEGLVIASSILNEDDESIVAAVTSVLEMVADRIKNEFKAHGHFGMVVDHEAGKFIFTQAGENAVLATVTDVNAETDKVLPWSYFCANKIMQMLDLGDLDIGLEFPKMDTNQRFNYKMVVLGDGAVGKTSLIRRFIDKTFKTDYKSTIGVSHLVKKYNLSEKISVTLNLWDLAGQEMFKSVRKMYFQGAEAAALVYDVTRPETFEHIDNWINEIKDLRDNPNFVSILIGNKIDLGRKVDPKDGAAKAKEYNITFIETSAKEGDNVDKAFGALCYLLIKDRVK